MDDRKSIKSELESTLNKHLTELKELGTVRKPMLSTGLRSRIKDPNIFYSANGIES